MISTAIPTVTTRRNTPSRAVETRRPPDYDQTGIWWPTCPTRQARRVPILRLPRLPTTEVL
ncbi:MAG: hypothetical protein INR71_03285 [Terriglobus roseus]|nr:hypothetical protein [Terriglobus roseus]